MNFEQYYMNRVQLIANLIDPNILIAEVARAGGKTEGITGPRILKVINAMPGELSFLVHKTYVALMTNVWPNIQAYFSRPVTVGGIHYIDGVPVHQSVFGQDPFEPVRESCVPRHFRQPRYPIAFAKHSVVFRNGAHLQLVSSDQPESVAGRSAVHAFIEEMKHNSGEKLKSRLFPSLRGGPAEVRKSHYYQGVTGVSDTARVDLGEDDWFQDYETKVNTQLTEEIATASWHFNNAMCKLYTIDREMKENDNPALIEQMRLQRQKIDA